MAYILADADTFCKAALLAAVQEVFQARPETAAWLRPFRGVYIDDCTQLGLPDDAYPLFPSTTPGRAGMKVLLRWELQGGALRHLGLHPARTGDRTALAQAPPLPSGCLHLVDLGFTDFQRLQAESAAGIFWSARLPAHTVLFLSQPVPFRQRYRRRREGDPAAGV
ncbi:MAG TPA: hypothetical protein VKA46_37560, partial [Gemmataceae bacterium]|nr:hypothetical protein [Gemmataceae bacterium]